MMNVYKGWGIVVFFFNAGLRALIYRPGATRAESDILTTSDPDEEEALIETAKRKIDCLIREGH